MLSIMPNILDFYLQCYFVMCVFHFTDDKLYRAAKTGLASDVEE